MEKETALQILDDLRTGKITEYLIEKNDFMTFREALIEQEDKAQFVGIAQKGGNVIYQYRKET